MVGLQVGKRLADPVPADVDDAVLTAPITVKIGDDGEPDFAGPVVHGKRGARFLYLVWASASDPATAIRRAKLPLTGLAANDLASDRLMGRLRLTDGRGEPVCATVKPPLFRWEHPT